jgi:hypothetical protein
MISAIVRTPHLSLCLLSVKKRAIYESMEYTYEGCMIRLISTRVRQEAKIKKNLFIIQHNYFLA